MLGFRSSDNLAAAYGIAVTGTMASLTTFSPFHPCRRDLQIALLGSPGGLFGFFLVVDLLFFSANMIKIEEGGWFPLAVAVA